MSDPIVQSSNPSGPSSVGGEREWARHQVERKRKLRADLIGYLVINAFLIGVWAVTGFGYFWPGWVLAGWGVLWLLGAWNVYSSRPVNDADIDRELQVRR